MNLYTPCLSSLQVRGAFEFELFAFLYTSLSFDGFNFVFIGCCTGCNHKQVPYKDILPIHG